MKPPTSDTHSLTHLSRSTWAPAFKSSCGSTFVICYLLEDVLARGRRASVVAGPPPEGASNIPGAGDPRLPFAEAGRGLCMLLLRCGRSGLPLHLCVGARCSRCTRGLGFLQGCLLGSGIPKTGAAVHFFSCHRLNRPVGLLGQRIGEASHPGPGASAVTRRKRAQARQTQLLTLLEGILKLLMGKGSSGLQPLLSALGPLLSEKASDKPPRPRAQPKAQPKAKVKAKAQAQPAAPPAQVTAPAAPAPPPRRAAAPVVAAPLQRRAQPAPSFALRPGDFHGTVVQYAELSTKLASVPAGPLVLLAADEEQADAAAQLIKGKGLHSAWVFHRDRASPLVIPLASGTRVVTQHVIRTEVCCTGVAAPSLKSAPKPAPAPTAATTVIRIVACQGLAPQQLWQRALASPRGFVQEWGRLALPLDKQHCLKDAWQFAKHERGHHQLVQGLARVDSACVGELFRASGVHGVFVEPVGRQDTTPVVTVTWHKPTREEDLRALHERLLADRPAFGLLLGTRELGARTAPSAGTAPTRTWTITGTPPPWTDDYIRELLVSQTTLQDPAVVRRLVRKGACSWWIRASAGAGTDAQQIVVGEPGGDRSYWVLPAPTRQGLRERGQPLRAGAFSYKREAFATVEKPVLQASEAADVAQDGGRPAPDAKKSAAASVRYRKIPGELERHVVPGDGSCLFHCLAQALPAVASHDQARAETIAHMRKYTSSYQKRWDGCDDRQQHLESYADYLIRMQAPDAQAGALEILAAAKTHKCTIVVLPERADMPPSAFNYGPSFPKVIVWHTGRHFDLLTPKANTRLPDEIAAVTEEAGQGSFPRVGGPSAADLAGAEGAGLSSGAPGSTFSACASVASSAPTSVKLRAKRARVDPSAGTPSIRSFFDGASVASSAPTSAKLRAKRTRVAGQSPAAAGPGPGAPDVCAAAPACASDAAPPVPSSVSPGAQGARPVTDPGSTRSSCEALPCAVEGPSSSTNDAEAEALAPVPGSPVDSLDECMPAPVAADAQPRFDSRGRRLKGRTAKAKDHWKCDWCDYVARGKHWCAYRHAHLKAWHPEHLQDFGKKPPQFVRPGPEDEILWPCPFCDKALLQEDTPRTDDVLLQARLRHRRQCHPQIAKRHFLLARARSGAQKATAARLADGVARRLLKRRKGDVRFFRIPWTGKPAKKPRATRVVYACSSCRATADTARQLKAIPCERRPGSSSRVAFVGRLRALIDEDRHEASLLEGCRQLLACLTPPEDPGRRLARKTLPPPALREHDVVALASPSSFALPACAVLPAARAAVPSRPSKSVMLL